jgi:hypothetical protein
MSERIISAAKAIASGKGATIPLMKMSQLPEFFELIKQEKAIQSSRH